jgi:hypothetical protein
MNKLNIETPETSAGKLVRYAKDHILLVVLIIAVIIIAKLIFVGFPRLQSVSHEEDMGEFLSEKEFLINNFTIMMSSKVPVHLLKSFIPTVDVIESFEGLRDMMQSFIQRFYKGDGRQAIMDYFLYDMNLDDPVETIAYAGKTSYTTVKKLYRKAYLFSKIMGDKTQTPIDDKSKGEDQALHAYYEKMNLGEDVVAGNRELHSFIAGLTNIAILAEWKKVNRKDEYFFRKIALNCALFRCMKASLVTIIDGITKHGCLSFIESPAKSSINVLKDNFNLYGPLIQKTNNKALLYSSDFKYDQVHEYFWYVAEVFADPMSTMGELPMFNPDIHKLLMHYTSSDAKTRQLARKTVLKNNIDLCDFIDKRPIWSKIYFTQKKNDALDTYRIICDFYRLGLGAAKDIATDSVAMMENLTTNVSQLKTFFMTASILDLYFNVYESGHRGFNSFTVSDILDKKFRGYSEFFMDIWTPYFDDFIVNRIWMYYKKLFTMAFLAEVKRKFDVFWYRVGDNIYKLPYNAAEQIKQKRKSKPAEPFTPMVVEGFLGKVFGPIIAIGKFFINIGKIVMLIVDLIMKFAKDPFGTLIDIFKLIFTTIFAVVLMLIYIILSLPPINYVILAIYFVVMEVTKFLAYVGIIGALMLVITLICVLFAIINAVTKGSMANLVKCQNSPGSWFIRANYHLRNKYERSLLCAKPCPKGYAPDERTGMMCMKISSKIPSFCPQASAMRIYSGLARNDLVYSFQDYKTTGNARYETKLPIDREWILYEHYMKGNAFLNGCKKPMAKYDNTVKILCSSLDVIEASKPFNLSDKHVNKMRRVCRQAYCRSNGSHTFCSKLVDFNETGPGEIIKNICLIIFAVIMFTVISFLIIYIISNPAIRSDLPSLSSTKSSALSSSKSWLSSFSKKVTGRNKI